MKNNLKIFMNILINIVILLLFVFVSCENIIVTKRVVKDNIMPENELDLCDDEKLNDEINKYSIKISQSGNGTVDLSSYKEFYEELLHYS